MAEVYKARERVGKTTGNMYVKEVMSQHKGKKRRQYQTRELKIREKKDRNKAKIVKLVVQTFERHENNMEKVTAERVRETKGYVAYGQ